MWIKPSFVEVQMNAEIGAYQGDDQRENGPDISQEQREEGPSVVMAEE